MKKAKCEDCGKTIDVPEGSVDLCGKCEEKEILKVQSKKCDQQ